MHDYDKRFKYKFYTTTTRNPSIAYHQDTDSQQNNEIFIRYLFSSPQPCYSRFSFILGWYIFTFFTLSARNFLHPNRAGNNFSATFPTTIAHNLCKFSLSLIQTGSIEILPNRIEQTADLQRAYIRRTHGTNFPPGEGGSRQTYPDPDHDRPVRVLVTQSKRARHTIVVQRLGCWRKAVSFFFRRGKSTAASFPPCLLYLADKDIEFWWTPLPYLACMGILNTHAQTSGGHSLWRLVIRVTRHLYEIAC